MFNKIKSILVTLALCIPLSMQGVFTKTTYASVDGRDLLIVHDSNQFYAVFPHVRSTQYAVVEQLVNTLKPHEVQACQHSSVKLLSTSHPHPDYFLTTWRTVQTCFDVLPTWYTKELWIGVSTDHADSFGDFDAQARALVIFTTYLTNGKPLTIACLPEKVAKYLVAYLEKIKAKPHTEDISYSSAEKSITNKNYLFQILKKRIPAELYEELRKPTLSEQATHMLTQCDPCLVVTICGCFLTGVTAYFMS